MVNWNEPPKATGATPTWYDIAGCVAFGVLVGVIVFAWMAL